ncbi:HAD family phosphatase [candidate division KSB1 bacterium]|nr:HAD family phosphatase [candidate division KSB1 bacterium]
MIQSCIFDMDGVIVDTEAIHIDAFRYFLKENDIQFSEEFLISLVGYSIQDNMQQIKKRLPGASNLNIENGINRRNDIYMNLIASLHLQPLPGVLDLIACCQKKHLRLAVASSSDFRQVDLICSKLWGTYSDVFDVIVTGDDVLHKKPAPDIYLKAINKIKLPPQSCLALEDSRAGVASAKAAGLVCYAIRNRYTADVHLAAADNIIDSLAEVITIHFKDNS